MRPRLVLVVLITAALLAAAGWAGALSLILSADRVHAVPILGGLVTVCILKGWQGDWHGVKWWAEALPIVGLVLTSYGIIEVYPEVLADGSSNATRAHTIMALLPNCIMGAGCFWLLLLRRICDQ